MAREKMDGCVLEIEVDGPHNECLGFRPLPGRNIRGRFDLNRVAEPMARLQTAQWPQPIVGQQLGIDEDGTGYIREPLHDPEHAVIREKIEKQGLKLEPAMTKVENIHLPSWLFWMSRAVESGLARVVSGNGKLPDKIEGKPRKNFITREPELSSADKLTAAIERQSALFEKLLSKLGEK